MNEFLRAVSQRLTVVAHSGRPAAAPASEEDVTLLLVMFIASDVFEAQKQI